MMACYPDKILSRFLWVKIQFDLICQMTNDKAVRDTLSKLPRGINECYRRLRQVAVKNVDNVEEVKGFWIWPVGSFERFNAVQLAEAIAIHPLNTSMDIKRVVTDPEDLIQRLGGLVHFPLMRIYNPRPSSIKSRSPCSI
jgi:hypothetical protein